MGNGKSDDDLRREFEAFLEDDDIPNKDSLESQAKESAKRSTFKEQIDLHRMTVDQAKEELEGFIGLHLGIPGELELRVITGKGRGSGPSGGVLVRAIYDWVKHTFSRRITKIDSAPYENTLHGLPLRGHFDIKIKLD